MRYFFLMDELLRIAGAHGALPLDVLVGLTLLSIVPFLLVMCTSFVRIAVVLSLVRSAIGATALPPNAALTGLAFVLTLAVMAPAFDAIRSNALEPYARGKLTQSQAVSRAIAPIDAFMLRQAR